MMHRRHGLSQTNLEFTSKTLLSFNKLFLSSMVSLYSSGENWGLGNCSYNLRLIRELSKSSIPFFYLIILYETSKMLDYEFECF